MGSEVVTESMFVPWNEKHLFFSDNWIPLASPSQNARNAPSASYDQVDCSSYAGMLENQATSTSHFIKHQSDHGPAEFVSNLPHFVGGNFSEMDSFSSLHNLHQITSSDRPPNDCLEGRGNEKKMSSQSVGCSCTEFQHYNPISDKGIVEPSPNGKKRKRLSDNRSQFEGLKSNKRMNASQSKGMEKEKLVTNMRCQHAGTAVVDSSCDGEAPKEVYVHVRAKRGQATNSHSLAERVRREKIVNGCNFFKSLFQDAVRFITKKGVGIPIIGDPEMKSTYPIPEGMLQEASSSIQSTILQPLTLPHVAGIWHDELQASSQMNFISYPAADISESNGNPYQKSSLHE